jgi:hypothetical protein
MSFVAYLCSAHIFQGVLSTTPASLSVEEVNFLHLLYLLLVVVSVVVGVECRGYGYL